MNNSEAFPPPAARPPGTVVAMSILWCLAGCLSFLVWLIERNVSDLIFACLAAGFTVLILKGFGWVFWTNLGLFSLGLGIALLQLQIPNWAPGTPPLMVWIRASIAVGVIILHEFRSLQRWFGVHSTGWRWQVVFWLLVAGLTALGQYILPTVRALRG
jgi:hypothetical protein